MRKLTTTTAKVTSKLQKLTIGLDLGDRSSHYCVLDESGRIGRQLLKGGCAASFRPGPLKNNCVEDLDLKQTFKFAVEEVFSLDDRGLHDRIIILPSRE